MKFLVVDDSATSRRIVVAYLKGLGYTDSVEAVDGIDALEKLKTDNFDILITDWNMPRLNGVELAGIVSNEPNLRHIPIMLITTRGDKEDILKAVNLKISAYITKPFTQKAFDDKLAAIVGKIQEKTKKKETKKSITINHTIDKTNISEFDAINFSIVFKNNLKPDIVQLMTLNKNSSKKNDFVLITKHIFRKDKVEISTALYGDENILIDKFKID